MGFSPPLTLALVAMITSAPIASSGGWDPTRSHHDDLVQWEGGIDRGRVGCHMGRNGSGGCMTEANCVLPVGRDLRENCMLHNLERHGLGRYSRSWAKATYACSCCNTSLFSSADKFDDGHGFATFTKPITMGVVGYRDHEGSWLQHPHDTSIHCERCGAHLGNVRATGPAPLYRRYHVNSDCVQQHCELAKCAEMKGEHEDAKQVAKQWRAIKTGDDITVEMRVRRMIIIWGILIICVCLGGCCCISMRQRRRRRLRQGGSYAKLHEVEAGVGRK